MWIKGSVKNEKQGKMAFPRSSWLAGIRGVFFFEIVQLHGF